MEIEKIKRVINRNLFIILYSVKGSHYTHPVQRHIPPMLECDWSCENSKLGSGIRDNGVSNLMTQWRMAMTHGSDLDCLDFICYIHELHEILAGNFWNISLFIVCSLYYYHWITLQNLLFITYTVPLSNKSNNITNYFNFVRHTDIFEHKSCKKSLLLLYVKPVLRIWKVDHRLKCSCASTTLYIQRHWSDSQI
jgi:hypothetical protein